MNDTTLLYATFPNAAEAERVAETVLNEQLAACVNIFPGMIAIFEWQGALDEAAETAMLIKTTRARQERVLAVTKRLHPYELPALLVLEPSGGSEEFCAWIVRQARPAE